MVKQDQQAMRDPNSEEMVYDQGCIKSVFEKYFKNLLTINKIEKEFRAIQDLMNKLHEERMKKGQESSAQLSTTIQALKKNA